MSMGIARPDFDLDTFLAIMPYRNPQAKEAIARDFTRAGLAG
ncbi:MAG: hypothetical protein AAFO72_12425 [Pseudomonadota bacterium]